MELKDFTSADWYTVLEGIGAVTGLIVVSDMSGPIGLTKEATAAADVLRDSKWQTPFSAALRTEIMAPTKERQEELRKVAQERQEALKGQGIDAGQAKLLGLELIRTAVAFVQTSLGEDAGGEYRQILADVAQKTAEAAKEGGFFGIGGEPVSAGEQSALDEITAAIAA